MKLYPGMNVSGSIEGRLINKGRLQYEFKKWYFCQDVISGHQCINRFGYKFSWLFEPLELDRFPRNIIIEPPKWDEEHNCY